MIAKLFPLASLLAVLALAACKDERPPHWEKRCTAHEAYPSVMLLPGVNGQMLVLPTTEYQCVKREWQCLVGRDFQGDRRCSPRQSGE